MACINLHEKANGSRLRRILVDKGTQALRQKFDSIHPPSTLTVDLSEQSTRLLTLWPRIIKDSQGDKLCPSSGTPDSKTFDITLLTILLRNICRLRAPAAGWDSMPPASDTTLQANIVRIKLFRNKVYGHLTSIKLNDIQSENLLTQISKTLADLRIPQHELDEVKKDPLSPEEESYVEQLKDWKLKDEHLKEVVMESNYKIERTLQDLFNENASTKALLAKHIQESLKRADDGKEILLRLAKYHFKGDVKRLTKSFQEDPRQWLFNRLDDWFSILKSRVMILTAGPGVGKSVFSGKVCEMYKEENQFAACHFCKFNDSNLSNLQFLIHSLASHMCDTVLGGHFAFCILKRWRRILSGQKSIGHCSCKVF